ncbi:MAG: alanine/ornithine racemase family PLP-dependent enzyme [Clostridia bacterium]|nr:alanine/ornithine racemase family PLP-dependent enzyme [Clostridia bacterium]
MQNTAYYPTLEIHMNKVQDNIKNVHALCSDNGVKITGVVKGCNALQEVAEVFEKNNYHSIGSSRISQLKKMKDRGLKSEMMLVRIPMLSELEEVIQYADISLNSDRGTLIALNDLAKQHGKVHKVVLMTDLGDLREGVWDKDEFIDLALFVEEQLEGLRLYGIGTNLGCYGSIRPTEVNMTQLAELAERVELRIGRVLDIVSGGATTSVPVLVDGKMPKKVNHLRVGEGILLARDLTTPDFCYLEYMHNDTFVLTAQIIEIQTKPSHPVGELYIDAFGNRPTYVDVGMRKRALLGVGRQDFGHHDSLKPIDERVSVVGSSSDHLIVDITDVDENYQVGDTLSFTLFYQGMLFLSLCEDVQKIIVK